MGFLIHPFLVAALSVLAGAASADRSDEMPVRIQLAPGKSSASVVVDFSGSSRIGSNANPPGAPIQDRPATEPAIAAALERRFVLAARAGQTLKVDLRLPGKEPGVTLSLRCPGDGHAAVGRNGRLQGSMALPESGDYIILVTGAPGRELTSPAELQVELVGSPNRIAARPYTGTYYRQDVAGWSIDVRELLGSPGETGGAAGQAVPGATTGRTGGAIQAVPGAAGGGEAAPTGADGGAGPRLAFSIAALRGVAATSGSPNPGTTHGIFTLRQGAGVYEKNRCRLTFRFGRPGTGEVHLDEAGDCGFGQALAAGDYRRTSLCSAPEDSP